MRPDSASGAISGILAAYLVLYPRSHVRTLIPLGLVFWTARVPAWVFIGLWFVMQLICGLASISEVNAGGVAYSAHIGGFLTGSSSFVSSHSPTAWTG